MFEEFCWNACLALLPFLLLGGVVFSVFYLPISVVIELRNSGAEAEGRAHRQKIEMIDKLIQLEKADPGFLRTAQTDIFDLASFLRSVRHN